MKNRYMVNRRIDKMVDGKDDQTQFLFPHNAGDNLSFNLSFFSITSYTYSSVPISVSRSKSSATSGKSSYISSLKS